MVAKFLRENITIWVSKRTSRWSRRCHWRINRNNKIWNIVLLHLIIHELMVKPRRRMEYYVKLSLRLSRFLWLIGTVNCYMHYGRITQLISYHQIYIFLVSVCSKSYFTNGIRITFTMNCYWGTFRNVESLQEKIFMWEHLDEIHSESHLNMATIHK